MFRSQHFNALRQAIQRGEQITDRLVWDAFGWSMLINPSFADDLRRRMPSALIRDKIYSSYREYKALYETVCDYFSLPDSLNAQYGQYSAIDPEIKSRDGFVSAAFK